MLNVLIFVLIANILTQILAMIYPFCNEGRLKPKTLDELKAQAEAEQLTEDQQIQFIKKHSLLMGVILIAKFIGFVKEIVLVVWGISLFGFFSWSFLKLLVFSACIRVTTEILAGVIYLVKFKEQWKKQESVDDEGPVIEA